MDHHDSYTSGHPINHRLGRVTELEDELHQTLQRYETIFRATHDVLYDLDLNSAEVVWNEALYTQLGYNEDEPSGTLEWWASHIHPDDALGVERELSQLLESTDNTWNYEYRFARADGSYVEVRDRGYILRAPDGQPLRIIGSFLDITHQKQLERAKDEFSSLISHQLRTPLTVIQMYSDMLVSGMFGALSSTQLREIKKINNSSVKLISLVNDILAISSIELQKVHFVPTKVNIHKLITGSIEAVEPIARQKSIAIKFVRNDAVKTVFVDQRILEQILHNLLTNAIRYSPAETGKIKVSLSVKDGNIVISVKDNGIGIPAADKKRIFERFYRANNAMNTQEHGTGLGLYYIAIVTKAFGGKVWFSSSLKTGTTFYVAIPQA